MNQLLMTDEVLTLEEAASFLRLSPREVRELAKESKIPGRFAFRKWRFLKSALKDWLHTPNWRHVALSQEGALADDENGEEFLESVYKSRGRREVEAP